MGRPIYDAHHHLWDLTAVRYPWLQAKGVERFFGDPTPIQKNYLPDDLRNDASEFTIEKSVHIQVGAHAEDHLVEAEWVETISKEHRLPSASVAYCDLDKDSRHEMLDQLQTLSTIRGIRQIVGRSPDEDKISGTGELLKSVEWLNGLRDVSSRGLSFDLQLIPDQMQAAWQVFKKVDELPVALCHCGSPWYRDEAGWNMWKTGLERLAELPNLVCKISGLSMFDQQWTSDSLKPVVDVVLDTFGPERCMFGSNFPVDKLHCDYQTLWLAYETLTRQCTSAERDQMFRTNCRDFYKLNPND